MNRLFFIFLCYTIFPSLLFAQKWEVPENKKKETSPFVFDATSQKNGLILYKKNCMQCHGEPGKANFIKLNPLPGDISTAKFSNQTDGELFFKISNGRGAMPRFMAVLKEVERWQVISFIRSFHKNYVQPKIDLEKLKYRKQLFLTLQKLNDTCLTAKTYIVKGNDTIPSSDIEIVLFKKCYFGKLQLGESKLSDKNGIITYCFKNKLRADTSGIIRFIAKPFDQQIFGDYELQKEFIFGIKNDKVPLNKQRAMWNTLEKTPIWILSLYVFGLLAVWGVIMYIVFQLINIKRNQNLQS